MAEMSNPVFDADEHYYEPLDAFTRHLPKAWKARTVQQALVDGKVRFIVGGKINKTIANPTFDPVAKPGSLAEFFRGNPRGKTIEECLQDRQQIPACFRDRDARIEMMDEQDIHYTWMLPTVANAYEEDMQFDPEACSVAFHAFNEWLLDDWGYTYKGRIFSGPYLAMGDVDAAVKEVEWALVRGARLFVVRPCGVYTRDGWKSPGDPRFDPIWARIREAGVVVVPHVSEVGGFGLDRYLPYDSFFFGGVSPLQTVVGHERPIANYLAALVCDKLFERFPGLHIASIENGAEFLPLLMKGLMRAGFQNPGYFAVHPKESFLRHVWVAPFWEDDLGEAVELIGADRVLFGSDWPHAEAMARPRDFDHEVAQLNDPVATRKIMYENTAYLTGLS